MYCACWRVYNKTHQPPPPSTLVFSFTAPIKPPLHTGVQFHYTHQVPLPHWCSVSSHPSGPLCTLVFSFTAPIRSPPPPHWCSVSLHPSGPPHWCSVSLHPSGPPSTLVLRFTAPIRSPHTGVQFHCTHQAPIHTCAPFHCTHQVPLHAGVFYVSPQCRCTGVEQSVLSARIRIWIWIE